MPNRTATWSPSAVTSSLSVWTHLYVFLVSRIIWICWINAVKSLKMAWFPLISGTSKDTFLVSGQANYLVMLNMFKKHDGQQMLYIVEFWDLFTLINNVWIKCFFIPKEKQEETGAFSVNFLIFLCLPWRRGWDEARRLIQSPDGVSRVWRACGERKGTRRLCKLSGIEELRYLLIALIVTVTICYFLAA